MVTYEEAGKLIANGYIVTPLHKNSKRPVLNNWNSESCWNPDPKKYPGCGIGILCGVGENPVYAVDIDIYDKEVTNDVADTLNKTAYRVGRAPKKLLLYRGEVAGDRKQTSNEYDVGRIEVLGFGQQFAAYGVHPDTKEPYRWESGYGPIDTPVSQLPEISSGDVKELFNGYHSYAGLFGLKLKTESKVREDSDYDPNDPLFAKDPIGVPAEKLKSILALIDPDCSRDVWRNIGFALHHETDGSAEGFTLWDEWSSKGLKYKDGECEKYWEKAGNYSGEPITAAYLLKQGKKKAAEMADDFAEVESKSFFEGLDWEIDRFDGEAPDLPMVIDDMLPRGIVGLFYSAGGAGKSTLELYFAVLLALSNKYENLTLFGRKLHGGTAVVLTAEDPDIILHRRIAAIREVVASGLCETVEEIMPTLKKHLKIVSTLGHDVKLFRMKNEELKTTAYYDSFSACLAKIPDLSLVFIDTRTRYSGAEEEGNDVSTTEFAHFEKIAVKCDASVIVLHHSNKQARDGSLDGSQAYRGKTGAFDTARVAWYLRAASDNEKALHPVPDCDSALIFENAKNNYIPKARTLLLSRKGYEFSHCELMSVSESKEAQKDAQKKTLSDKIVAWMQIDPFETYSQAMIVKWADAEFSVGRSRVVNSLNDMLDDGIIEPDGTREGRSKMYMLTEIGRKYDLTLEKEDL